MGVDSGSVSQTERVRIAVKLTESTLPERLVLVGLQCSNPFHRYRLVVAEVCHSEPFLVFGIRPR